MAALSPMLSRGKKRARSSSPASSPAAEHPKTPAINVQKLAQALKTPNADPTLELWDRYSLNGPENVTAQPGVTNPALAQLMISSSPTPTKKMTPGAGSGNLRRAISAGLTWTKRRKIEKSKSAGHVSNSQRELEAASKSSLVSALLDSVTSSIHEPSPRPQGQRAAAKERAVSTTPVHNASPTPIVVQPEPAKTAAGTSASSDYGDDAFDDFDDFDDDTFMELEASIAPSTLQPNEPKQVQTSRHEAPEPSKVRSVVSAEEFEDLDDTIFDDAEATIAASSQTQGAPTPQAKAPAVVGPELSDEEFGDDFDADIDLDAMEFAATQSLKKSTTTVPAVRSHLIEPTDNS